MLSNILMSWLVLFAFWRFASRWFATYDPVTHDASLQRELGTLKKRLNQAEQERTEAIKTLNRCRLELKQTQWELESERKDQKAIDPTGRKFAKLKRAFSKQYHPDSQTSKSVLSDKSRAMVFKDFWPVIQEIEREKSK